MSLIQPTIRRKQPEPFWCGLCGGTIGETLPDLSGRSPLIVNSSPYIDLLVTAQRPPHTFTLVWFRVARVYAATVQDLYLSVASEHAPVQNGPVLDALIALSEKTHSLPHVAFAVILPC